MALTELEETLTATSGSGIRCTGCGGTTSVVDSRGSGDAVRRRRRCDICNTRYTTFEMMVDSSANRKVMLRTLNFVRLMDTSMTVARRQMCEAMILEMMEPETMPLTDEEQTRLTEILAALVERRAGMRTNEREFIADIEERFDELGGDLRLSRRQWNWLFDLEKRYA